MANINVKKLMQDEVKFFDFLRSSPQHAVVMSVIETAIDLYHRILPRVIDSHDLGMQQDISLIIRYMKREVHDRVAIRYEHSMLDGVDRLFGDRVVEALLQHQANAIAEYHALHTKERLQSPTMEHLFVKAGAQRLPSWGAEYGRANVSQLLALRMAREDVFTVTREMHREFFRGNKLESWRYKQLAEEAQRRVGLYAEIDNACSLFKMLRELKGAEAAQSIEEWVFKYTRISEFRDARDRIQSAKCSRRIYSKSWRNEHRLQS